MRVQVNGASGIVMGIFASPFPKESFVLCFAIFTPTSSINWFAGLGQNSLIPPTWPMRNNAINDLKIPNSSAFTKALYGQKTNTHHGKYVYRKHGILDDIAYRKLIRGAFIIQDKDKKRIIDFFERFYAEYYVRVVELTEEDCEIMGLQIE